MNSAAILRSKNYFGGYSILMISGLAGVFLHDLTVIYTTIYLLFGLVFLQFMINLGRKINLLEIISLIGCLIYLVTPMLSYQFYGRSDRQARLWDVFMKIDPQTYFSLALPATLLLVIGLNFPLSQKVQVADQELLRSCREYLRGKNFIGFVLIGMGMMSSILINYVPDVFVSIVYYFIQLTFIGFLYLLYSGTISRIILIPLVMGVLITQSILTGMYGELIFWSILGSILLIIGKHKIEFLPKFSLLVIGLFMIFLIQSIKQEYRSGTWKRDIRSNDSALFFSLIRERIMDPVSIFAPDRLFSTVVRANQGFLVGRVMRHVPSQEPFANGETIISAVAASLVPRFVWVDKPKVGGHENVCRFLGDCGKHSYSYNIGQMGEAYVNFGKAGGAFFMFCYGLFINYCFATSRRLSIRYPTVVLWIPLLFFAGLSLETDVLTFLNSFIKACAFCWFCYFVFRYFLKIRI